MKRYDWLLAVHQLRLLVNSTTKSNNKVQYESTSVKVSALNSRISKSRSIFNNTSLSMIDDLSPGNSFFSNLPIISSAICSFFFL